jgi:hypothetical protein
MKMFKYPQFHFFQNLLQIVLTFFYKNCIYPMSSIKLEWDLQTTLRSLGHVFFTKINFYKLFNYKWHFKLISISTKGGNILLVLICEPTIPTIC